jgi:N4-acetylcytidine amidohydrolase
MLFKKVLIEKVLEGKKTMTSRSKPLYKVGETTNLMADRDYSKISGKYIKIIKVYKKALSEFTDADANKEGFSNIIEFKEYWKKNIGEWTPTTIVWVHEFEVISQ